MDIVRFIREGNFVVAIVKGDSGNLHVVSVDLDDMDAKCTCESHEYRKDCKHLKFVLSKLFVEP
jgi:uncharacterized Zn finger protein